MPGKNRIVLNGWGRNGKLMMMAAAWPYLMEKERRIVTQSIEGERMRENWEAGRRHGLDRVAQTYALICKPDKSLFHLPETSVTDICINSELPKGRYHDRIFTKDYAKKKKAKRRQQKQARRNSRK